MITASLGVVDGGAGTDEFDIQVAPGVAGNLSLADGGSGRAIGNGLKIANVERMFFVGSGSADMLTGEALGDTILGGAGTDRVESGSGDDVLFGDRGNDRITGGADRFLFQNLGEIGTAAARDVVSDFDRGSDLIDLYLIDAVH